MTRTLVVTKDFPPRRGGIETFVRQLFETRRALELPIIELAAERADSDERSEIEALAKQFRKGMELAEFRRLDRRFHAAIARASGNQLLVEMYGKVLARLFDSAEFDELLGAPRNRREVVRIVDEPQVQVLPVVHQWVTGRRNATREAARTLDDFDVALIQHEYGIFGGSDGEDVLELVSLLHVPIITVLHTVLTHPTPHQHSVLAALCEALNALEVRYPGTDLQLVYQAPGVA